jgi:hypothetical protein
LEGVKSPIPLFQKPTGKPARSTFAFEKFRNYLFLFNLTISAKEV